MKTATLTFELFLDLLEGKVDSEEKQHDIIRQILEGAGYDIVTLEKGDVHGREITSQDESRSFVANPTTGLRILGMDKNAEPSCYLEMLWRRTAGLLRHPGREEALKYLEQELSTHVGPFKPVIITEFGEMIRDDFNNRFEHLGDEKKLSHTLVHGVCNGYVDVKNVSRTHKAVVCRSCQMRVVIPNDLETIGDLREHFAHLQPKWREDAEKHFGHP